MAASKGHIWPEYWIDCHGCDYHAPLGCRTREKAIKDAVQQRWSKIRGIWYCCDCAPKFHRAAIAPHPA